MALKNLLSYVIFPESPTHNTAGCHCCGDPPPLGQGHVAGAGRPFIQAPDLCLGSATGAIYDLYHRGRMPEARASLIFLPCCLEINKCQGGSYHTGRHRSQPVSEPGERRNGKPGGRAAGKSLPHQTPVHFMGLGLVHSTPSPKSPGNKERTR